MSGLISIEKWTSAYETELEDKGLLGWVLSADKEVKESSLAFDGEEQPGLDDMAALRQWKMDWTSVKNCLERALGSSGDLVHQHSLYGTVRTDSTCRAIKRLCTIRDILNDLVSLKKQYCCLPDLCLDTKSSHIFDITYTSYYYLMNSLYIPRDMHILTSVHSS
jgi:hypothetical protein